jgi:hypothetical protein
MSSPTTDTTAVATSPPRSVRSTGETKITFYSTTTIEESKSKYPKQSKTSYTLADGKTEISFGNAFRTESNKRSRGVTLPTIERDNSVPAHHTESMKSRSGRSIRRPVKYEPIERPVDDYKYNDYDSDDSSV